GAGAFGGESSALLAGAPWSHAVASTATTARHRERMASILARSAAARGRRGQAFTEAASSSSALAASTKRERRALSGELAAFERRRALVGSEVAAHAAVSVAAGRGLLLLGLLRDHRLGRQ